MRHDVLGTSHHDDKQELDLAKPGSRMRTGLESHLGRFALTLTPTLDPTLTLTYPNPNLPQP